MVTHSISLGVEPHMGLMTKYLLLFDSYGLVFVDRPVRQDDGSVFCICCWSLQAQSFSGPSPLELATYFTASDLRLPFSSPPTTRRVTVEVSDLASTRVNCQWAEQSRAVAYCRQPASTGTLGIEPRWDPWPYICSVSRHLFFSSFVVPPLIKWRGWAFL
jgi:hypothetical protein